jgi:hypothetical protein
MTACPDCGVDDALGRHDPACAHAIAIDLPRLAEGEDPIAPHEDDDPLAESGYDGPPSDTVSPNHPAYQIRDEPGDIQRAPDEDYVARQRPDGQWEPVPRSQNPDAGLYTGLWISYRGERDDGKFDAVVFASELDALRHAVREGYNVHPLELGRSLREQVQ